MKLYIYDLDTKKVIAVAEGNTNAECDDKAGAYTNDYGTTYTPALGTVDGLIENDDADIL